MSKYYCLVLTVILVTNTIVHEAADTIVSHEYTKVHKNVSKYNTLSGTSRGMMNFYSTQAKLVWKWNMADDGNWTASAIQVETSKANLECAVKCSQIEACRSEKRKYLSFYFSIVCGQVSSPPAVSATQPPCSPRIRTSK